MIRSSIPLMIAAALLVGCGSGETDKLKANVADLETKLAGQKTDIDEQQKEIDRLVSMVIEFRKVPPRVTSLEGKVGELAAKQDELQTATVDPDELRAQVKEIVEPILERRLASLQGRTDRADRADRGTRDGNREAAGRGGRDQGRGQDQDRDRRRTDWHNSLIDRIVADLDLTGDQQAKSSEIWTDYFTKSREARTRSREEGGDYSEARDNLRAERDAQLKEVLSAEQYEKYEETIEKMRSHRGSRGRRGQGHGRGKK